METTNTDKPLTITQAAAYTGFSKAYIYKLASLKKIPHYKPENGKLIFSQLELEKFVFRNRQAADYELAERADAILMAGGKK